MPDGTTSPARFDEFRELHEEGLGRNAIARRMDITNSVASRTAEHLGLAFDRSRIEAANRARLADLNERRSLLAVRFQEIAEDSLERIYQQTTVFSFGGKENEYNDHTFDEAPIAERQKLVTAAAIAVDKSLKLAPAETSNDLDEAKSMLGSLGQALVEFSRTEDEQNSQAEDDEA